MPTGSPRYSATITAALANAVPEWLPCWSHVAGISFTAFFIVGVDPSSQVNC